jgi:hypothetical protein
MNQAHDSPRSESSSPLSPRFQDCCTDSDDEGLQNFIHSWLSGITSAPSLASGQPVSSRRDTVANSPSLQPTDSGFLPAVSIQLSTEARRPLDPELLVRRLSSVRCVLSHRELVFD